MTEATEVESHGTLDELITGFTKVASEDAETLVGSHVLTLVGDHHLVDLFTLKRSMPKIAAFFGEVRAITDRQTVDYS